MDKSLIAQHSISIKTPAKNIWQVLTLPEYIKAFLYGTEVSTDWKVGSPIAFKGNYDGVDYHDKGVVLESKPNEILRYSYWSSFSGLADTSENYSIVSYLIETKNESECMLTWHQQGFSSEQGKCHTEHGLKAMLEQIKNLAEK